MKNRFLSFYRISWFLIDTYSSYGCGWVIPFYFSSKWRWKALESNWQNSLIFGTFAALESVVISRACLTPALIVVLSPRHPGRWLAGRSLDQSASPNPPPLSHFTTNINNTQKTTSPKKIVPNSRKNVQKREKRFKSQKRNRSSIATLVFQIYIEK